MLVLLKLRPIRNVESRYESNSHVMPGNEAILIVWDIPSLQPPWDGHGHSAGFVAHSGLTVRVS